MMEKKVVGCQPAKYSVDDVVAAGSVVAMGVSHAICSITKAISAI